jgi:YNFM family putative membrane transporter
MSMSQAQTMPSMPAHAPAAGAFGRTLLIGMIAFLTVVDLFGTQAILPALARSYGVSPAPVSRWPISAAASIPSAASWRA